MDTKDRENRERKEKKQQDKTNQIGHVQVVVAVALGLAETNTTENTPSVSMTLAGQRE